MHGKYNNSNSNIPRFSPVHNLLLCIPIQDKIQIEPVKFQLTLTSQIPIDSMCLMAYSYNSLVIYTHYWKLNSHD